MHNKTDTGSGLGRIFADGYSPISWLCYALKNKPMLRINLTTLSKISIDIHRLTELPKIEDNELDLLTHLLRGIESVDALIASSEFPLRLSRNEAVALKDVAYKLLKEPHLIFEAPNADKEKLENLRLDVIGQAQKFESVFAIELQNFHTYIIRQIGVNDVNVLIESGENIFGESTKKKLPQTALDNAHEAGKALVFNLPTACGFYMLRSAECVIVCYVKFLGATEEEINKNSNWGRYEDLLKKYNGDQKIIELIGLTRKNHRNPIMHPKDTLSLDDADILMQICRTLIQSICQYLPEFYREFLVSF